MPQPFLPGQDTRPLFDTIARRYDLLNLLLSGGLDRYWRAKAVAKLELTAASRVLDAATGTGDVALTVARAMPGVTVVGLDQSTAMLRLASTKLRRRTTWPSIQLVQGDCQALPFGEGVFDAVTIAFGIRNVQRRAAALHEFRRVLKPGGQLVILELGQPRSALMAGVFRCYGGWLLPRLGGLLSSRDAYRYLPASMQAFPDAVRFLAELAAGGFEKLEHHAFMGGMVGLFHGRRNGDAMPGSGQGSPRGSF